MRQDPKRAGTAVIRFRRTAIFLCYLLSFVLLLDLLSYAILGRLDRQRAEIGHLYSPENYKKAYPQYSTQEMSALLTETHSRGFVYDPYQAYREAPWHGRYVNVSADGYRCNGVHQNLIEDSAVIPVFIFGGSTTFGYGVADSLTIAAYLERRLQELTPSYRVYNFGAGGYFSNQEVIWFKRSLALWRRPVAAVFMDGPNEFTMEGDDPLFAGAIRDLLGSMMLSQDVHDSRSFSDRYLSGLAIVRLYRRMAGTGTNPKLHRQADAGAIQRLMERYKTNCMTENAIANLYGTKTLFVVQPVPQYDYDLRYHTFGADPRLDDPYMREAYSRMKELCTDTALAWLWLGGMQHTLRRNLYVDNVHYNPEMSAMIADSIFDKLKTMIPAVHAQK